MFNIISYRIGKLHTTYPYIFDAIHGQPPNGALHMKEHDEYASLCLLMHKYFMNE